jgi:hypothetical protein
MSAIAAFGLTVLAPLFIQRFNKKSENEDKPMKFLHPLWYNINCSI